MEAIEHEQGEIVDPCFVFDCANADPKKPKRMQIHSQILSDAKNIISFGALFLANWQVIEDPS